LMSVQAVAWVFSRAAAVWFLRLSICRVAAGVGTCGACPMSLCRMTLPGFAPRTPG
jgi:hypothetical protein